MSVITPFDELIYHSAPDAIKECMQQERKLAGLPPFPEEISEKRKKELIKDFESRGGNYPFPKIYNQNNCPSKKSPPPSP